MLNSHIHLDFKNLPDNGGIVPSTGKQNWNKVKNYKNFALGIHPWFITKHNKNDFYKLEDLIKKYHPLAIGECGLDYAINIDKKLQIYFFIEQLNLAKKYNLPVIIHAVKSYEQIINILKKYNLKIQIHNFNGSAIQGNKLLDLGAYLSFGISKKSIKLQNFIKNIPQNKVLIETDEKPNFYLKNIALEIANLKGIKLIEMIKICDDNSKKLFNL